MSIATASCLVSGLSMVVSGYAIWLSRRARRRTRSAMKALQDLAARPDGWSGYECER